MKEKIRNIMQNNLLRILSVPRVGIEPTRCCHHWILNPARLPIPPPRQVGKNSKLLDF